MAAAGSTIETLLIKIGADITDLKKGLEEGNKELNKIEKTAASAGKGMTANISSAVTAVVTKFALLTAAIVAVQKVLNSLFSALDDVAALGRLSQSTGIAVERLSELKFAAASVGIPFEQLQQAISGLSQKMIEGLTNPTSNVVRALGSLGISLKDASGNVRNFADLLPLVADKFSTFQDGANKAMIAATLFGEEAGPKLVPLLNQGRAGIERLAEEARKTGTVTKEQVKVAQEYQSATAKASASISALVTELAVRLYPALTIVADAITALLKLLPRFAESQGTLKDKVNAANAAFEQQIVVIETLEKKIAAQGDRASALTTQRLEAAKQHLEVLRQEMATSNQLLIIDEQRAKQEAAKPQAPSFIPDPEKFAQAQFELEQLMERVQGSRTVLDELSITWFTHADAVEAATAKIRKAYEKTEDQQRAIARVTGQLHRQEQGQILQVAQTAAQAITALWPKQKGAAIAAAVINTAVGITKALSELLPPWSWIQAGLIAATGAAQIAAIRSATPEGGGATPGAGGGGNSGQNAPVEAPMNRSITVMGIDRAALFSGAQMENLIMQLNEETKRGSTLISTQLRPT